VCVCEEKLEGQGQKSKEAYGGLVKSTSSRSTIELELQGRGRKLKCKRGPSHPLAFHLSLYKPTIGHSTPLHLPYTRSTPRTSCQHNNSRHTPWNLDSTPKSSPNTEPGLHSREAPRTGGSISPYFPPAGTGKGCWVSSKGQRQSQEGTRTNMRRV